MTTVLRCQIRSVPPCLCRRTPVDCASTEDSSCSDPSALRHSSRWHSQPPRRVARGFASTRSAICLCLEKAAVLGTSDSTLQVAEFVLLRRPHARSDLALDARRARTVHTGHSAHRSDLTSRSSQATGAYYIRAGGTVSPSFRIGPHVYDGAADFLLRSTCASSGAATTPS